jgi:5-methylcytosine-specific restriction enzyme subunit McrC|tara:strand:- start:51 stop:1097 length:1047 start_codon:yes stop_codon:yes gene_type:complete
VNNAIPVQNVYYLFLYAWNKFQEGKSLNLNLEESPDIPNLFSNILTNSVKRLIKRGLHKDYRTITKELKYIKGKINFPLSIKNNFEKSGKIVCELDELSIDCIPNKIIKRTLQYLLTNKEIESKTKQNIKPILKYLDDCNPTESVSSYFGQLRLTNNNYYYKFALNLCSLINKIQLPTNDKGTFLFKDVLEDETIMSDIFETFLRNFYTIEQNQYEVSRDKLKWDISSQGGDIGLVPVNITDITLRSSNKTIVIDAKYYKDPLVLYRGKKKIRQEHLRQITSYLDNLEKRGGPDSTAEGMLIYPEVKHQQKLHETYTWKKHKVSIHSIDLNQPWQKIHRDLFGLVGLM